MIEPMYRVEMTPITRTKQNGEWATNYPASGRVLEMYRGSYIGAFGTHNGSPHIFVLIKGGSRDRPVDADRLDPVIQEIWKEYFYSLTFLQRWKRRLYAHRAWLVAFLVAVVASVISSTIVLLVN